MIYIIRGYIYILLIPTSIYGLLTIRISNKPGDSPASRICLEVTAYKKDIKAVVFSPETYRSFPFFFHLCLSMKQHICIYVPAINQGAASTKGNCKGPYQRGKKMLLSVQLQSFFTLRSIRS